jgi:diguanylate cyclase (GGDEF)-like protein
VTAGDEPIMKILVADDSNTTRELISASLIKFGHKVIAATNGIEALEKFKTEHPDLIILDVIMHGMDGFDCAQAIRAHDRDDWVPIIFLSGAVDDENIARGINAGGDDYLTKPFSEVTLAAKIKAMQRIVDMRQKLFATTEKLGVLSAIDALTGINNRLQFEKVINEKIKQADEKKQSLALLFIDLDNFKSINDHLGHHIGDLLLKEIASRLSSTLRSNDFLARIGGDEFAVILSDIQLIETAGQIAKKILNVLTLPFNLAGNDIIMSSSIGIANYPFADSDVTALIQSADVAMYHAKSLGRNNFQYYTEELHKKNKQIAYLDSSLKFAIERKELFLTYQPIFDLKTRNLVGMETLLRWKHPELGMISPEIFIPIAEENGMIEALGWWVLRTVCEQGKQWDIASIKDFKLSINISSRQLLHKNLPSVLNSILHDTNISPHNIELELTETILMSHTGVSSNVLKEINAMGICISIDDFGTGYSSLMLLKRLPIRALKIDKSFVSDLTTNSSDAIIVNSVINLAKNLGLVVIAEGIETEEQFKFLVANGCTQGQGYYLSKPLTTEQITDFINKTAKRVT